MLDLRFTREAVQDLRTARRWYEQRRAGLGLAFEEAVRTALQRIQNMPEAAPAVAAPFRKVVVRAYPYDIYYSVEKDAVLVVLIVHSARDPAWTSSRLGPH